MVSSSQATQSALAALGNDDPESLELLANNVLLTPCPVPRTEVISLILGIPFPEEEDEAEGDENDKGDNHWRRLSDKQAEGAGRELGSSYYGNYSYNYNPYFRPDWSDYYKKPEPCDKTPYDNRIAELKDELTYEEYYKFVNLFRRWRYYNKDVCDDRIFDAIKEALCKVQIENEAC